MERNEISMVMDVKLDIHDKRPESLKFKAWTKCRVKIEAVKCLPCFLRIIFTPYEEDLNSTDAELMQRSLTASIKVPGLSVSLAVSRTKEFTYGLFWTQSRRNCYIYFALESETCCRQHMKWIKKSIKNLELHRKLLLEERRHSRNPENRSNMTSGEIINTQTKNLNDLRFNKNSLSALGPLPKIPHLFDENISSCSARVSEIYEEIFEGNVTPPPRLSRRYSRTSIASGIYEEMKLNASNFNVISEEINNGLPPPIPPLPPPRKRINTCETEILSSEILRSHTNPETDMAKKKKYKNVFENIFAGVRSKRTGSLSENQGSIPDDIIAVKSPKGDIKVVATKRQNVPNVFNVSLSLNASKRNSFSSPDLSKINFLDTFDEEKVAGLILNSYSTSGDLYLSNNSLNRSDPLIRGADEMPTNVHNFKADSMESLNISEQIPLNFNFSACNTSSINLIGANGAVCAPHKMKSNNILVDDLTGYCFMAPIAKKTESNIQSTQISSGSSSSGYSSASYSSTTSSCTNSNEVRLSQLVQTIYKDRDRNVGTTISEDSVIYENMFGSNNNSNCAANKENDKPNTTHNGHFYENLLSVKAAQELGEQVLNTNHQALSTSTPTDSPQLQVCMSPSADGNNCEADNTPVKPQEENYYQTPRKSIISVDDKIPSYYPNSCDTKMRRRSHSPIKNVITSNTKTSSVNEKSVGLRHLVNLKMQNERRENLYISSPQKIIEERSKVSENSTAAKVKTSVNKLQKSTIKTTKVGGAAAKVSAAVQKVSSNVYSVKHPTKKFPSTIVSDAITIDATSTTSANNNNDHLQSNKNGLTDEMKDKLQTELIQLSMLQKINFKFDDADQAENVEYDCVALKERNSSNISKNNDITPQRNQQLLQPLQESNTDFKSMTQSKFESPTTEASVAADIKLSSSGGSGRKFASLPRFKKIDFSPLRLRINNVWQRSAPNSEF